MEVGGGEVNKMVPSFPQDFHRLFHRLDERKKRVYEGACGLISRSSYQH